MNKEKTSGDEGCIQGEMVLGLYHNRCQTRERTNKGQKRIYVDFDTEGWGGRPPLN